MNSLLRPLRYTFPFILLLCTHIATAQPAEVRFEDETIPSGIYEATISVSARNTTVQSTSQVTFRAGQTVRLEAGFKVEVGATFNAEVDPSVGSGGGGGPIVLSQIPPNERLGRFFADRFDVYRPALSLRGFDSGAFAEGDNFGYGLKQVLERTYDQGYDDYFLIRATYREVVKTSNEGLLDPQNPPSDRSATSVMNINTDIMECRAFVTLVTYVLEQNGYTEGDYQITPGPPDPTSDLYIPSHTEALTRLRAALLTPPGGALFADDSGTYGGDAIRWTRSIGSFARAVDLYIALENAYGHFGHPDHTNENAQALLTRTQKRDLLGELHRASYTIADGPFQVLGKEVEPGNRPMKMYVAGGYAALALQDVPEDDYGSAPDVRLAEAVSSLWQSTNNDRRAQWSYQGSNGERFWAEGAYYLEFSLLEVLPFWHTMRANGLLTNYGGYGGNLADPFDSGSDWALNPLRWLADIVTPDGRVPPLDDGNKRRIRYANLMRWTPEYGDAELGRKYAWINEELGGPASAESRDRATLLNEIAIPRTAATQAQPPAPEIVNTEPPYNNGEQQLVVRRDNGTNACNQISEGRVNDCHFVLLNGEHGHAITRGEGHEQPDNMQLLYYVNGTSVLMDSGYDSAPRFGNSTWNHYYDHNVLNFGYGRYEYYDFNGIEGDPYEGGLNPPFIYVPEQQKVADHADINALFARTQGKLTQLHARQFLNLEPFSDMVPLYVRDVLFVDGEEPYLIDMNRIQHNFSNEAQDRYKFRMNYYANDLTPQVPQPWSLETAQPIKWPNVDGSGRDLHLFPMEIEFPLLKEDVNTVRDITREPDGISGELNTAGDDVVVRRLDLYDYAKRHNHEYSGFASVVQLRQNDPANIPRLIRTHSREYPDPWMGWVWHQDPNTIDVFIVRSIQRRLVEAVAFNMQDTDASFPDFSLMLPEDRVYGFVRIKKQDGIWSIDEDYQLSFEVPELMAQIDGLHAVASGTSATWTATAYGGSGSYTYRWHVGPDPNSLQDTGVTTADYTHSATADFYLRVDVTSGTETASSATRRVYVGRPAPPSDLVLLNPGDVDAHPRFTWQASPTPDVTYRLYRCEGSTPGCNVADNPSLTSGEDGDVTIQDNCPNHQPNNTAYHVTAFGTLGESDETNEVDLCGTAPDPSAQAVAARLAAASGQAVEALPKDYALEAAYPNPFNPSATIRYALPEAADVRLVVYDVMGREVARLVEGKRPAGYHRMRFDGSRLASGLYLYRLVAKGEAGAFSKTGRMVLVK